MIEKEIASQRRRTKEGRRVIVERDTALLGLLVGWRVVWGKESRKGFREVGHLADQASPRAVHEHILSKYVGQGSDRLARHANHRCRLFPAFAEIKDLPPL